MNDGIVIALITGGLSLFGSIFASITTSRLIIYRVNELEKKQDKHKQKTKTIKKTKTKK